LSESDTVSLTLLQDSKDHCLCEEGDLDRPDLIIRDHLGGIAGIPEINGEETQPFCAAQSLLASGFTLLTRASNRSIS
jgi:hypothetical protein